MRAIAKQSRTICIPFFDYYWIATASPREDRLCVIASVNEAIQENINSFLNIYLDRHVRFTHSRRQSFRSLLGELSSVSQTEGLSIQDNLIARNFLDLITNLSRFFKFPCLDRFIKLDFEILENNFFFSLSSSLEFLYFTSCKRSKILI